MKTNPEVFLPKRATQDLGLLMGSASEQKKRLTDLEWMMHELHVKFA